MSAERNANSGPRDRSAKPKSNPRAQTAHPEAIEQMIRARRLESVAVNPGHAREVLRMASQHLQTARVLAETADQAMAFTACYDAARKALTAVLAAHGLRARSAGGSHQATGLAAAGFIQDSSLGDFEWMRQVRNATEYPAEDRPAATEDDVAEGIDAAERIIRACELHLSSVIDLDDSGAGERGAEDGATR